VPYDPTVMNRRRGWDLLAASIAIAGCVRTLPSSDPVSGTDAGTDRVPPSTSRDAGMDEAIDGIDGGGPCPVTIAPAGTFNFLSAGNSLTCGIHPDGTLTCWGLSVPALTGVFKDVSALLGACGVRTTGQLDCAGLPTSVGTTPAGIYDQVVIAEDALCARAGAQVDCWGHAGYAPQGYVFESLTGGAYYMCGLEASQHAAVCWEPRVGMESQGVQQGPFATVDTGRFFACGLRVDGSVACWVAAWPPASEAAILQQTPPAGPFRELSVGEFHACALDAAGAVTCWGEDHYGDTVPPAGLVLAHVSAGSYHTCGIKPDGTVVCWGGSPPCGTQP